uniref:Uncharacterized protein n=1 Tax=Magallana gigas TaxID=29159 RepID=A0A8W8NK29_MAGGI
MTFNADALSRDVIQPCGAVGLTVALKDLPCGGCHYCRRAHERWQDFSSEPLGSGESSRVVGEDLESQYVEVSGPHSEDAGVDNDSEYLEVIDAHWHPTRMSVPVNLSALTVAIRQLPSGMDVPVRVVGGCAVYVDGPTPSPIDPPQPGWVTAVGLHPTKVSRVDGDLCQQWVSCRGGWPRLLSGHQLGTPKVGDRRGV